MIPVIVIVHLLKHLDLISYLAIPLKPVMLFLDLPPEAGIVWAMALANSIYGGLIAFSSLGLKEITIAQASTLGIVVLICHNIIIEVLVARRCGLNIFFQFIFRIFCAVTIGYVVMTFYKSFDLFQGPAQTLLPVQIEQLSLKETFIQELYNLISIFGIIFSLMMLMSFFERVGIMRFISKILELVLKPLGLSREILPPTAIGLSMGLTYGAGLIIESIDGKSIDRRSIFLALTLMGICHSLIEDTILVLAMGGELWGLFIVRIILGYCYIFGLSKANDSLEFIRKWLLSTRGKELQP